MQKKLFLVVTVGLFLAGCAQHPKQVNYHYGEEAVENKNYVLGKVQEAYVGQPIVKVKSYVKLVESGRYFTPKSKFIVKCCGPDNVLANVLANAVKTDQFKAYGSVDVDGEPHTILIKDGIEPLMGVSQLETGLLMDRSNRLSNRIVIPGSYGGVVVIRRMYVQPEVVHFKPVKRETVDKDTPYINFEIVYSGVQQDTIKMIYREFSLEDVARVAFYQDLSFSKDSGVVRFRDLKIEIVHVDNELIRYTVVED